jgi:hypothetical protein
MDLVQEAKAAVKELWDRHWDDRDIYPPPTDHDIVVAIVQRIEPVIRASERQRIVDAQYGPDGSRWNG